MVPSLTHISLAEPALVGREAELEMLTSFLTSADAGKGNTVFVSGEAGSGKTRLANEFLNSIRQKKDFNLLSGWCFGQAAFPYFPFLEAFNNYFSSLREKETVDQTQPPKFEERVEAQELEIRQWLAGSRQADQYGRSGALSTEAWKDQAFAVVTKALQTISAQKTTILFLEDLHWADSASLALIYYIARSISSHKTLVLGTFRSEELTADSEGRSHPLAETLRLMKRERLATEINLEPLNETDVGRVAESMVGGAVLSTLSSKLAKESRGNALFVVESLRMLSEKKSLVKENDLWGLSVDEIGIPSRFKDIVLRRLGSLKFNQRRILDAASVMGEKFDVELLSRVLNQDNLEVLETLYIIAQTTSIVSVEESFFRFDHAKLQEAIYEEIPLPLKKGYHARIAERLETINQSGRLPLSEIAHHYDRAGNTEKAVTNALAAGEEALARWSNAEAIKHFSYVLENISASVKSAEQKSIALEGLGDAYYANSMFKEASEAFEHLADSETGKTKLRAFRKAMDSVFFGRKDHAHMIDLVNKAAPLASSDRLENARVQIYKTGGSIHEHRWGKELATLENGEAALKVFEEEYSLPDVARVLEAVGTSYSTYLLKKEGLSFLERSIALFQELGDLRAQIKVTYWTTISYNSFGLFREAIEKSRQTVELGWKLGDYDKLARTCFIWSKMLEAQGRVEEAIAVNLKGIEFFDMTDAPLPRERMSASFVTQFAKLGNLTQAEEYFEKLMNMARLPAQPTGHTTGGMYDEFPTVTKRDFARAQAVIFAAKNQWEKAEEYFNKALEIAGSVHPHSLFSQLLVRRDLVWALNRQGRTKDAELQVQEIAKIDDNVEKEFARVYIIASLMAPRNVTADQEFEMRLDLVNVSRKNGLLVKVEELLPEKFKVLNFAADSTTMEAGSLDLEKEEIGPFEVKTIRIRLRAPKPDTFNLNPRVTYVDESGKTQTCTSNQVTITVNPARSEHKVLPGRITTGYEELDEVLFGGIPENYAVALTSPSTDERELLIKMFLEAGAAAGEITFLITAEAANTKNLAKEYPSHFYLVVCNPQADTIIKDSPNVSKLKGVENLTDIDIALAKAFRTLDPSPIGSRRICIDIVSDALLQHHAVNTRRWLSALLPTLKSKGFTILAVIDPTMHPPEELQSIVGIFDGEIRVVEKEISEGIRQTLRVRKLLNQKYLEKEIVLTKEMLSE